ncbi:MAG: ATP-binding protein [Gammaproteobacteria bacterium]|nr:ATP-binding protein [Gammaproteobacteria bacterium]
MLLKSDIPVSFSAFAKDDTGIWKSLYFLNLYRIVLAGLFVTSIFIDKNLPVLGSLDPVGFAIAAYLYLAVSVLSSFMIHWRWPNFEAIVLLLTMVDITALTIIMHTSGGIETGLGMLIVVAIAGNSMLTSGKGASLFAALAALAILTEQIVSHIGQSITPNYSHAGFLGAAVFATALLSYVLSRRIRETEQLAEQRGVDLANMAQLNDHVIKRLQSGVIVVDKNDRIRLMNQSAWHMLGLPILENAYNKSLKSISDELHQRLQEWKYNPSVDPKIFRTNGSSVDVLPGFTTFGSGDNSATLIFLEDTVRMRQQAQQIKLASLGRLTASIAHEIRNPLGAISHADQLLSESPSLGPADKRLTEIIHTHTERVNSIIENVLLLSRRGNTSPENIKLNDWIKKFVSEFVMSEHVDADVVAYNSNAADITVRFDPTQLHQILWNLSHNGLRFGATYPKNPKLELRSGVLDENRHPFLDVIDHGPGIDPDTAQHIFEPFFTTDSKGSGLGLYIARELCELNKAIVRYVAIPAGGSCFRIEFASNPTTH